LDFKEIKSKLTNCTYLQDASVEIEGIKIYGTPYQPHFFGWAFNRDDKERQALFAKIPSDADVVVCHGPPFEILDKTHDGLNVGCKILREELLTRVKPQLAVFGHIHEAHGITKLDNTLFVNAANCNVRYKISNPPVVVDVIRKKSMQKEEGMEIIKK